MDQEHLELSAISETFLESLDYAHKNRASQEGERYEVSQTASLFGFVYEKLRNSIEFNEEHLIRRLAITRILKRRLEINKSAQGEGENLIRELMWGRYITAGNLTKAEVKAVQNIIDSYVLFAFYIQSHSKNKNTSFTYNMLVDFLSSEVDEHLSQDITEKQKLYLYFFFHVLRGKVHIPNLSEEEQDRYFYVAAERAYTKNDNAFIRYHLFTLKHGPLAQHSRDEISELSKHAHSDAFEIDQAVKSPYVDKLTKFAQKQVAPFRILYQIIDDHPTNIREILTSPALLKEEIEKVCVKKNVETGLKLRKAAIRSIIYIFLTKMIFVIILEFPLTKYIFNEIDILPLIINTLLPPLLMGVIVFLINPPSSRNTERIIARVQDILDKDPQFESKAHIFSVKNLSKNPSLLFAFSIMYIVLFSIVFSTIYMFLELFDFNIISKSIFIFFISVVAFFGYRIRQTSKEYVLETSKNIFTSFATFLFLPILSVGKILSSQIARINVFIILFDYIIETPFKFFIDVFEEWSRFVKARKDELL